jgi:hypothetical protein
MWPPLQIGNPLSILQDRKPIGIPLTIVFPFAVAPAIAGVIIIVLSGYRLPSAMPPLAK